MNYLLDTHCFIWFSEDDAQLPVSVKTIIEDRQHTIYLSLVSLWEMAIKVSLNKLTLSDHWKKSQWKLIEAGFSGCR